MKSVYSSHRELAHVWANFSPSQIKSGQNIRSTNMHAAGSTLFTYQTALAKHVTCAGRVGVLLNETQYSNSSSKHLARAADALSGHSVQIFSLTNLPRGLSVLDMTPRAVACNLEMQVVELYAKASNARASCAWLARKAAQAYEKFVAVRAFYGLKPSRRVFDWSALDARAASESVKQTERDRVAKERSARQDAATSQACAEYREPLQNAWRARGMRNSCSRFWRRCAPVRIMPSAPRA